MINFTFHEGNTHRCYYNIFLQSVCDPQDDFEEHSQNGSLCHSAHSLSQFLALLLNHFSMKRIQILSTLHAGVLPTEHKLIAAFTYTASTAVIKTISAC